MPSIRSIVRRGTSSLYDVYYDDGTAHVSTSGALPGLMQSIPDQNGAAAFDIAANGDITMHDGLTVSGVKSDGFLWVPPAALSGVPVSNVTYTQDKISGATKNIPCLKAAVSGSAATVLVTADLTGLLRSTAGKGLTITEVDVVATWTTQPLTGVMTFVLVGQTFAAAGAAAAAPSETLISVSGAALVVTGFAALTTPTAGRFSVAGAAVATPQVLNAPATKWYVELGFPSTDGTILYIAGVRVYFNEARY